MGYRPYNFIIEAAAGSSTGAKIKLQNDTGSTISVLTPVTIGSDGKLKLIDVSVENDAVKTCGVTEENIFNTNSGDVAINGKISNITTAFAFGDYVYVSKLGALTNILPTEGSGGFVAGDYIIKIGVIARNPDNPANKDLLININLVGQI